MSLDCHPYDYHLMISLLYLLMLNLYPSRPYIALCRGLIAEGHTATIVTHDEYKDWIEGFGVNHRAAGGDPGALMKLSVEHSVRVPPVRRSGPTKHLLSVDVFATVLQGESGEGV